MFSTVLCLRSSITITTTITAIIIIINITPGYTRDSKALRQHRTLQLVSRRPYYAREIWKWSFICTVRPTVFSNLSRNGALPKRFSNRRNWKRRLFVFVWTEIILKTQLFANDGVTIIMWFQWPSFPQTQIQSDRWLLRFKFLRRNVDGNIRCVFRVQFFQMWPIFLSVIYFS